MPPLKRKENARDNEKTEEQNASSAHILHESWELLIDSPVFIMYRRPLKDDSYLYEYKCIGRYTDVSSLAFFQAQIDNDYRKIWDNLVISLDVLDIDRDTGNELIHWVTHFPYPMYSREYIFVRRACIDPCDKQMIVTTKAVKHDPKGLQAHKSSVRVNTYQSTMIIRPHGEFDQLGMDYVLVYVDDPKAPFPGPAYKWMVKYGVPNYLLKVHDAAVKLDTRPKEVEQQYRFPFPATV